MIPKNLLLPDDVSVTPTILSLKKELKNQNQKDNKSLIEKVKKMPNLNSFDFIEEGNVCL